MIAGRARVRLAELVATLSLGTDLGLGQPMEHVLRQTRIALRLSERLALGEADRVVVYYAGLLAWVGCHVDAYEQARWFGDDIALKAEAVRGNADGPAMLLHLAAGKPLLERVRTGLLFLGEGRRWVENMLEAHWAATDQMAARLGLGDDVRASLKQSFERWDGKDTPLGLRGDEILLTARVAHLAEVVEVYHRTEGVASAISVARKRSGAQFDPKLVDLFCDEAENLLSDLHSTTNWDAVIDSEPALQRLVSDEEFEDVLEAIADFADLKSPYTLGHSRAVADLAGEAARTYGLPQLDAINIRRAGLVHDIGRLGVSNAIWDKRGTLTPAEMERVRLHPYLTQRMLAFSPALAPLGAVAVQNHERLDGSGYPSALAGGAITPAGRLLAAADVYHAMVELRPHRPAHTPKDAAAELYREVVAGRLDGDAVEAVLRTAGHRSGKRRDATARLTARELEVLRLVARGLSNKAIGQQLVISGKTAGNHVERIYAKIGVKSRAGAGLYAMTHGLMTDLPLADYI